MAMSTNAEHDEQQPPPHRRRKRYRGTHPRRFEQRYKELHPEQYPRMQEHLRARGRTPAGTHVPILVRQVLEVLEVRPGQVVADCTLGYGGHAEALLERLGPAGRLIGFDVDAQQLQRTRQRLEAAGHAVSVYRGNFAGIAKALGPEKLDGYDVIFADLGVSSMQIDDPARGFSYKHDGPLDMRMDDRLRVTAAELLATMDEDDLSAALAELGDEPDAPRIARQIVRRRRHGPITRTLELVETVFQAKGLSTDAWLRRRRAGEAAELHPAARTFQALRILVNDELGSLRHLLRIAPQCLRPGGRIGILTFHSGEDRLVKQAFREQLRLGLYASAADEPIRPDAEELRANPRSRPAKLRWARKPGPED